MGASRRVVFYHSPQSRSGGTLFLLEELGADYELKVLNLEKKESRQSDYLAVTTSPTFIPRPASRRRSAIRGAARTCAGCSSTTPRSSRR